MIRSFSLGVSYQTAFANGLRDAKADVPVEKDGAGQGFGPYELLEAAFATTCLTMMVQMYAAKHDLPVTAARCEVHIDRSIPKTATLHYALTTASRSTAR
jgi:uncharacterized OsmC-like protein